MIPRAEESSRGRVHATIMGRPWRPDSLYPNGKKLARTVNQLLESNERIFVGINWNCFELKSINYLCTFLFFHRLLFTSIREIIRGEKVALFFWKWKKIFLFITVPVARRELFAEQKPIS